MLLTIIGGGPGGYTAAFAAAKAGCKVTLVEAEAIGGVCLNHGCIPTKALRASADAACAAARLAEYGIDVFAGAHVNMAAVKNRKNHVISVLNGGLLKACRNYNIDYVEAGARLLDAHTVLAEGKDGRREIRGDAVILATGSRHMDVPGLTVDHKVILDSDDALELEAVPKRLLILGGGVIGCEMACIYKAFGSDVTIVQRRDRLLSSPFVDKDVSALVNREMRKQKIRVLTGRTLRDVRVEDGVARGSIMALPCPGATAPTPDTPFEADAVLVTVGRSPMTEGLGLAEAGVAVDDKGWIKVSDRMETSLPGVYAIGDILGPKYIMLAHVAAMEGLCALENLLGRPTDMRYDVVPAAIFTSPEIGYVGLSEVDAHARGNAVCSTFHMRELGKSQASGELPGFLKLVADADSGRLLGAHMAGAHTTDMIAEAALAIKMGATIADIAHTIHAHPTLSEGFYEAARLAQESMDQQHTEH